MQFDPNVVVPSCVRSVSIPVSVLFMPLFMHRAAPLPSHLAHMHCIYSSAALIHVWHVFIRYIHSCYSHSCATFIYVSYSFMRYALSLFFFNISVMQPGVSLTYIRPQTLLAKLLRYEHIASRSRDTSRWVYGRSLVLVLGSLNSYFCQSIFYRNR